ncbi:hypothetical protein GCM10022237_18160 [Nocardioides ginsengisoli]|uniref:Major facilitator superfamily (MFS) profile domain-containing protein n=1 Tax=Nocardioides ginsengisoli TaxID=363868 RepID=A0ABW3W0Y2_9ACTN
MTLPPPSAAAPVPASDRTRTVARVLGLVAGLLGLVESGLGVVAWVDTAHYTGESSTASIGFLFALVIGLPGALALVLGVLGWLLARRVAGPMLSILGLMFALSPLLLFGSFWLGW